MTTPIYQVDAFTDRPYSGNPAAVAIFDTFPTDAEMQSIAAEMNLAETAFVVSRGEAYDLRWFTPTVEVDLCGHATLSAAHVLWETGRLPQNRPALFDTRSGRLVAESAAGGIQLAMPTLLSRDVTPPDGLISALGVKPVVVALSKFDYLVQVASANEVREAQVNCRALEKIEARGVILTALSDNSRYDFISRFFAPAAGIDEDPVTGSAHCVLGAFWKAKLGKDSMRAYQASRRGGSMTVNVNGDHTTLVGQAVTVFRGELLH